MGYKIEKHEPASIKKDIIGWIRGVYVEVVLVVHFVHNIIHNLVDNVYK
jgi:hypothetical protein